MIHVFIGTKAQFIKMMPIMIGLRERGIDYNFIDAGQHAALTTELLNQFGLRYPDVFIRQADTNINTIRQAISWGIRNIGRSIFCKNQIFQKIFRGQNGVCLIHGDTLTTLISLIFAKRCGIKVAHVEAGLRSYDWCNPFPEEIIRSIVMHYSDILFAPSDWAFQNLCKMGYLDKSKNIGANTGQDAAAIAVTLMNGRKSLHRPYALVAIHRAETIYSFSRLNTIFTIVERMSQDCLVYFVLHDPTRNQLKKHKLFEKFKQLAQVKLLPLLPYIEFLQLVDGADYIVTDGGSIQEESYYLNKPCMILRSKTERLDGIGENAYLTHFDPIRIDRFFKLRPTLKRKAVDKSLKPSEIIIDHLMPWA